MKHAMKKWALFVLRWGIAIIGIWWVVSNMTIRDRVNVLSERDHPLPMPLAAPAQEEAPSFQVNDVRTGTVRHVPRDQTVNRPERDDAKITVNLDGATTETGLLGLDLTDDLKRVRRFLVADPKTGDGVWVTAGQVVGAYQIKVPRPRVEVGIASMVGTANAGFLAAAVVVFPLVFLITAFRWNRLLDALGIHLSQPRTFTISMVGAFYNTFMPGSTGGDVLKAYYASKQTHHRTRAVLSVVIDRILGLLSLIILGGVMASIQYLLADDRSDPASRACLRVAIASVLLVGASIIGGIVIHPRVRKAIGVESIVRRLPLQRQVQNAMAVVDICIRRIGLMIWAVAITIPVHITVIVSAMLAGLAFDLPLPGAYYFVAVPVIVLAGAVPISPQGAGVMEFFAIQLTKQYGTTVSQAVALTMSIRVVQILWSLLGGLFVLRGSYHAPTVKEREELTHDDEDDTNAATAVDDPKRVEPASQSNGHTQTLKGESTVV